MGFSNLHRLNFSFQISFFLWCTLLCFQSLFLVSLSWVQEQDPDIQALNVGKELERQLLPFKMGQGIYKILGLKESRWYEVKISYPASIPASFSLQMKSGADSLWLKKNRRILNTEKLIFKFDSNKSISGQGEMYILVSVEPAGVVAKPGVQKHGFVLFNIVCDELSLGIPLKAWWVGIAAMLCLILASFIPFFFPLQSLVKVPTLQASYSTDTKAS